MWEFGKGRQRRRLTLKKSLFGHAEAVTCLTASAAYNIIVSGSRDRTCIIWDLNELVFVRQLRGHAAPVAAVTVNELTVSRLLFCYSTTTNTHTHTHTHPFNGPMSGTTRVGRYQKGKTNLDFTGARDSEWQWHQLRHMRQHLAPDR